MQRRGKRTPVTNRGIVAIIMEMIFSVGRPEAI
jgi:hypothetical protein